jgi:hypothetical protein
MAEGIGPIVVIVACTVVKPVAEADIVVVPGLKVVLKFADAYVVPLRIIMDKSTVPIFVEEDARLIVVSCNALDGFPQVSCNCTKMQV